MLGKKQQMTHEAFQAVFNRITDIVPEAVYREAVDKAAVEVKRQIADGKRPGFAWSGGKDSIALAAVMQAAGVHRCVFGMTNHLEYPEWLQWVTSHMPAELTVLKNKWDLKWLAANQGMLFPSTAKIAATWFKGIQHRAQELYWDSEKLAILFTGRRIIDGNYVGRGGGATMYEANGILRSSPIAHWSHELVLASLVYEGFTGEHLPPFYKWPRGFRCGTHSWAARQWCQSIEHGWSEVYSIDADIVCEAATLIPSAQKYLDSRMG